MYLFLIKSFFLSENVKSWNGKGAWERGSREEGREKGCGYIFDGGGGERA